MQLIRDDRKISIIGGLLLLCLTLATGMAVYNVMRQQIESTLGRGLDVALQGKARLFESQISEGLAATRATVNRPFLIRSLEQIKEQPNNIRALQDLQRNVDSLILADFTAASISNSDGKELARVGKFSSDHTPKLPISIRSNAWLYWNDGFVLSVTKDILDQAGTRVGSLTTEKSLPQLTESFSKIWEIGKTGEFIVCAPPNEASDQMHCLISQISGVEFRFLSRVIRNEALPMDYALRDQRGVIASKDYRHIPVIAAYAPLESVELGMVLKLDEEELLKPMNEQLKVIILYISGLIITEILLLYWLVHKLIRAIRGSRKAKERAEQFSTELAHKELALRERFKEITCLYEIGSNMKSEFSIQEICQLVFKHLIAAMQYPDDASAFIELDGIQYMSDNFQCEGTHFLQSKIELDGKICGHLYVFYPYDKPFLAFEEQKLLDAVARDIESWLARKRLEQALVSVAEENQRQIGQELHDNLGQQIAAIGYQAKALEKRMITAGDTASTAIATSIATQSQSAVSQCRQLAQGLLPFELETNGLIAVLHAFAAKISTTYKIDCHFSTNSEIIMNDDVALNLYRITQEAVNNAIRHGGAQHVDISLLIEKGKLWLSITDNGRGFIHNHASHDIKNIITPGIGIKIMRYRTKQIGATLEFLERPEGGVEVKVSRKLS